MIMKINKIAALVVAGTLIVGTASAQKGAYANVNFGYNFSLNSDVIGTNSTVNAEGDGLGGYSSVTERSNVTGSFGAGMNFGATFGMMFSDNIGAELGFNYLMGASYETTDKYSYTDTQTAANSYANDRTQTFSANMMQFNPSIVLTAGKTEGLNPYAKFGFIFGMGATITTEEKDVRTGMGANTTESTDELSEGMAFGWSGAFGATYSFSEKLGLFGEFNMVNMSYAPTKGRKTKYTVDGEDKLSDLTTSQVETKFEDSETYYSDGSANDEPTRTLKNNYSFSSLGLKIGLRFQF